MKQFLEFFPLIIFFAVYKWQDIYMATAALIVTTGLQVIYSWLRYRRVEKMQWISFALILVFGTLTLVLHDDTFIKWKVTVIYGLFASILLIAQFGFNKLLIKQMLGKELHLPDAIWQRINLAWAAFFAGCGALNIYIAFQLPQEVWVNFKVFGLLGMTLLFTLATGLYLYRHLPAESRND